MMLANSYRQNHSRSASLPYSVAPTSCSTRRSNSRSHNSGSSNGYGFVTDLDETTYRSIAAATGDDYFKDKPARKRRGSGIMDELLEPKGMLSLVALLLLVLSLHARAQKAWILREMQVQSFEEAVAYFHELRSEHSEALDEVDVHYSLNDRLEKRDEAWKHQVELLQNATKKESHRAVLDKYGKGPHHVRFTVEFHDSGTKDTFEVELAPLKWMPHANHLFLEQVSHGLWNNAAFHVNQVHILQVGPSTREHREKFRDYELERLAFPEYSEQFPHSRWTLGFAGRPGGPSWYINKMDNEDHHGPFGQEQHVLDEFADSCFAKVVGGFKTLNSIFDGKEHASILTAEIVNWDNHWTEKTDKDWNIAHDEFDSEDFDDDLYDWDEETSSLGSGVDLRMINSDSSVGPAGHVDSYYAARHSRKSSRKNRSIQQ